VVDSLLLDAFDAAACEAIVSELRAAHGAAASVYGRSAAGAVDAAVRKATRLAALEDTRNRVIARLEEQRAAIEEHFNVALHEIEEPQFLRYVTGDYFVAHQDGNTPLLRDDSRFRKISIVIFLSPQSAYDGGSLLFHGRYPDIDVRIPVAAAPGALVAFPSETTHEVTPLTRGERFTIVSWYR
jgi:SM-20-related protein